MKEVWAAVERGELKFASYKDQLFVFNYTNLTEFSKNWTPLTRSLRGAVLDKDGRWVGRALSKFFHVGEMPETKKELLEGRECYAFQKIDGSLINLHYNPYEESWQYTSKCSFTSDYVKAAERFLPTHKLNDSFLDTTLTFLMEIRFDEDVMRRVVPMPEGLYLLAIIDNETGIEIKNPAALGSYAKTLGVKIPTVKEGTFDDFFTEFGSLEGTEGYVLVFKDDGSRVKLKTSWYYLRNRFLDDIPNKEKALQNVQKYLDNFDSVEDFMTIVPNDYHKEVLGYIKELQEGHLVRNNILDNIYEQIHTDCSKKFAALAQQQEGWLRSALFAKYNGKDYSKFLKEH